MCGIIRQGLSWARKEGNAYKRKYIIQADKIILRPRIRYCSLHCVLQLVIDMTPVD
jgi:hypothetical protein